MTTHTTSARRTKTVRRLGAALLGMLVLVVSGCGMRVHLDGTVASDNTMTANLTAAMSSDLASLAQWSADTCEGGMGPAGISGTATVEPYNQDNYVGCTVVIADMPIEDADALFNGVDSLGAGLGAGVSPGRLSITRVDDTFVVDGYMDMSFEDPAGMLDQAGAIFEFDLKVSLTFPGKVLESNGTIEGNTVSWALAIGAEGTMTATAEAVAPGFGGSNTTMIVIIAAAVLGVALIAAVLVLVMRGRKAKAAAAYYDPYAGMGGYAPSLNPDGTYAPPPVAGGYAGPSYLDGATGAGLGTGLDQPPVPVVPDQAQAWSAQPQAPVAPAAPPAWPDVPPSTAEGSAERGLLGQD